jgi:PQQ-dependent dehydrogenase (methanol/ethanol family)
LERIMHLRARILLVVLMCVGAVLIAAQQNPNDTERNPLAGNPAAVAAGSRLFQQTCASCHDDPGRAPSLATGTFVHGSEDGQVVQTIRNGVPGSQMPPFPGLSTDQVWQLVSYIRSLSGSTPAVGRGAGVGPGAPVTGDPVAGEILFHGRSGCAACHEVNGRGGAVGPDLSAAGRASPAALRQKILAPNNAMLPVEGGERAGLGGGGRGSPQPLVVVARTKDGREIRGVRRNEDTFSLQMVDVSGQLHLLDKLRLAEVRYENRSLMPGDYATRLSDVELQHLIAYLVTLNGRDARRTAGATLGGGLTYDRLRNAQAEPQNWLHYWGDFQGTHYSPLKEINPANVRQLQAKWAIQLPGSSTIEATPLVVDGIMYTSGQPGTVVALDARTGRQIWRYTRPQKIRNPSEINPFNRGVAMLGNRVFFGTLDAALVALDGRTGLPLWEVAVADTMLGYSITSAPLVVKDKVIVGVTGGEFGARGFLDAYDAASGTRLWRWYAVPAPGEFGNDTWAGESWKVGGSPMWLTGSFDPALNLLYWTVGNPGPQIDRSSRAGDNLFSDSVVALDPDTGERKWHYQFTPNDGHDWDSAQDVILVDRVWHGQPRKLLLHADRNGMFYVLDRTNGRLLSGTPFVYQNWNHGFDPNGRPLIVPGSNSSPEGSFYVYPTVGGATNFQAPSYSPITGWMYLEYTENGQQYISVPAQYEAGRQYLGRAPAAGGSKGPAPGEPAPSAGVKAIDPETGKTMWDFKIFQGSNTNGVMATAGGVLFAATREGHLVALDAKTGKFLWRFQTGGNMAASPMSYAVDGKQYVAVSAGTSVYSFALPE